MKLFLILLLICLFNPALSGPCNREHIANNRPFPQEKFSGNLRVLTYNIRWDCQEDRSTENSWTIRKHKIQKIFDYYKPDLIALQEPQDYCIKQLQELCPLYNAVFFDVITLKDHPNVKDVALLFDQTRLRLLHKDYFLLSANPFDRSLTPPADWGSRIARYVIHAKFFDIIHHKEFSIFATHFESSEEKARLYSAQLIAQQAALIKEPLIVLGDFNLMRNKGAEQTYKQFFSTNVLTDIRDACPTNNQFGPDGTWIGWPYDPFAVNTDTVGERLDHIFVKNYTVIKHGVLRDKVSNLGSILFQALDTHNQLNITTPYPSDHLPVIADLIFN